MCCIYMLQMPWTCAGAWSCAWQRHPCSCWVFSSGHYLCAQMVERHACLYFQVYSQIWNEGKGSLEITHSMVLFDLKCPKCQRLRLSFAVGLSPRYSHNMLLVPPTLGHGQILFLCLSPMMHVNHPVRVTSVLPLIEYLKGSSVEHAPPHAHTL